MSRFKLWAGLIILFGAGAVTGIVATYLYCDFDRSHRTDRGPVAQHERIMKRLTHELSLTARQQADIEPIVTRAHLAILELRFAHQAEIEQILAGGMAELKTLISAEQQSGLDTMYQRLQQRWQQSREYIASTKQSLPVSR